MPVRFLSDAQREQLSGFPAELEPESLDRFFTLSGPDLAEVRRRHGDQQPPGLVVAAVRAADAGVLPRRRDHRSAIGSTVRGPSAGGSSRVLDGYGPGSRPAPTT